MSNYDYDCWGGPDGRCGVHKVPYVYLDGVPESGQECAASWVMRALRAETALTTTRDALHTAYSIIANAQNCLGDGDPTLGPQWHEAAQRFMQDYNANLDVYTGYRVSGRTAIQTVGDAPGCPACDGVAGTECRCHLRTGCDLGTTRCHRAEAAEAVIERVRELCEQTTVSVSIGCRCYTDECSGTCGAGRPLSWHLNPAAVLAALDGDSDE